MRVATKEIRWHETRPIFGCDYQPISLKSKKSKPVHPYARGTEPEQEPEEEQKWRLATAGGDNQIRMWLVTPLPLGQSATATSQAQQQPLAPKVEYLATLSKHVAVVNVVRFSPTGHVLASAGDDGNIILWVLSDQPPASVTAFGDETNEAQYAQEVWKLRRSLRVTQQEIYDLAWSPCGEWIICGSTDNTARVFSASDGQCVAQISDHHNYVQGVSWDPRNEFVATQSSDRHMHVYGVNMRRHASGQVDFALNLVGKNNKMEVHASQRFGEDPREQFRMPSPSKKRTFSKTSETSERPLLISADSQSQSQEDAPMDPPPSGGLRSRRSSMSSNMSVHHSPSAGTSRVARSPSPMPPLPAIFSNPPASTSNHDGSTFSSDDTTNTATQKAHVQTLYGGQDVSPFFRRLTWSPDGSLLLTPAGIFEDPFVVDIEKLTEKEKPTSAKKKTLVSASVPSSATSTGPKPTVYIYSRANIAKSPVAHLPGHRTASIAIRFNPLLWELRRTNASSSSSSPKKKDAKKKDPVMVDLEVGQDTRVAVTTSPCASSSSSSPSSPPASNTKADSTKADSAEADSAEADSTKADTTNADSTKADRGAFDLPYRMLYAVATHEAVYIYDTQQTTPICIFGNLHYAPFTDVTWSMDGTSLVLASQDGYCSIVAFEQGELGTPLPDDQQPVYKPSQEQDSAPPPSSSTLHVKPVSSTTAPTAPTIEQTSDTSGGEPKPKKRRVALMSSVPLHSAPAS